MTSLAPAPFEVSRRKANAKLVKKSDITGEYAHKHIDSPAILGIVGLCEGLFVAFVERRLGVVGDMRIGSHDFDGCDFAGGQTGFLLVRHRSR